MTNKELQVKLGNATEKFICKTLRKYGYWAYNMPKKVNGQPCDIIGIKGGKSIIVFLIDGKHVRNEEVSFSFTRVEPNQISSLAYARDFAGIQNVGFCVFFDRDKQLRWLPFSQFEKLSKEGAKSVNMNTLELFTEVLENEDRN